MHNIRQLNQEFQADQLGIQPGSSNSRELYTNSQSQFIAQPAVQELELFNLESPISLDSLVIEVDTRPIWSGRIELKHQAYLAEKNTWLAANPTVRPA